MAIIIYKLYKDKLGSGQSDQNMLMSSEGEMVVAFLSIDLIN